MSLVVIPLRPTIVARPEVLGVLERLVTAIVLHVYGEYDGSHWRLFLVLAEGESNQEFESIELNSSLDMNSLRAAPPRRYPSTKLEITPRRYLFSNKQPMHEVILSMKRRVPLSTLLHNVLEVNFRDQYNLNGNFSGCLWWCLTVLQDFVDQDWMDPVVIQEAILFRDALLAANPQSVNPLIVKGIFFRLQGQPAL